MFLFRDKLTKDEKHQPEEESDVQLKVKQLFLTLALLFWL